MAAIRNLTAEIVEVPLRHPFATARDQLARNVSRVVEIQLTLEDDSVTVGEAVPVAYVTGETPDSVLRDVAEALRGLSGLDVLNLQPIVEALRQCLPDSPSARAGVETAVYTAHAAAMGVSLRRLLGGAKTSVETDITLSIVPDAPERAREAWDAGIRIFKAKLGSADRGEDLARLCSVHEAVPGASFRLDANQAFEPGDCLKLLRRSIDAGIDVEMIEQPVAADDLAALDYVAGESPVPVFADEAVKTPADALRIASQTRVHGINVKLMKSGLSGALDIVAIARAARLRLMIGCMLETRRGIAASLALACGTGAFDLVDLDSHMLLGEEGDNPYFAQHGAQLTCLD